MGTMRRRARRRAYDGRPMGTLTDADADTAPWTEWQLRHNRHARRELLARGEIDPFEVPLKNNQDRCECQWPKIARSRQCWVCREIRPAQPVPDIDRSRQLVFTDVRLVTLEHLASVDENRWGTLWARCRRRARR